MSVLCPCGNIDCINVSPQLPQNLGISDDVLSVLDSRSFRFTELHHMSLVILDPAQVVAEKPMAHVCSIKCTKCSEVFFVVKTDTTHVVAYRKELGERMEKMRRGGCLLKLPHMPASLRPFICKAFLEAMVNTTSFEDFADLAPPGDVTEIIPYDSDLDVMFSPDMPNCYIGSFEDVLLPSLLQE